MQTKQLPFLVVLLCFYFSLNNVYPQHSSTKLPGSGLVFHLSSDLDLTVSADRKVTWVEQVQNVSFVTAGTTNLRVVDVKHDGINTDFHAVKFIGGGYLKPQLNNIRYSGVKRIFIVYKSTMKPLNDGSTDLMMLFGDRFTQVALETRNQKVNEAEYIPYTFSFDGKSEETALAKHAVNFNSLSKEYHDNSDPRDDAWSFNEWEIVEVEYNTPRDLVHGINGDGNWSRIELGRLVHNTTMFFQGEIAEIIVYDDSFIDRQNLKEYIKNKYKIQQRQWFTTASAKSWDGSGSWSLDSTSFTIGDAPYPYPVAGDKAYIMEEDTINIMGDHVNVSELTIGENAVVNTREFKYHNFHSFKGKGTYITFADELPNCDLLMEEPFYKEGGGIFHFSTADVNNHGNVTFSDDRYDSLNFNSVIVNVGFFEFDFGRYVHVFDTMRVNNSTLKLTHNMEVNSNFILTYPAKVMDDGNERELMLRGHFVSNDGCVIDMENTLVRFEGQNSKDDFNSYYQQFQFGGPTKVKKVRIDRPSVRDQVQIRSSKVKYQLEFNPNTPNNGIDSKGNYDPSLFRIELVRGRLRFSDNISHELITSTVEGEQPIRKISADMNIWISGNNNKINVNTKDTASIIIEDGGYLVAMSNAETEFNKTNLTVRGQLQLGTSNGGNSNGFLTVGGDVIFEGKNSKLNYRSGVFTIHGNLKTTSKLQKMPGISDPIIKFAGTNLSHISAEGFDANFRLGQLIIDKSIVNQPGVVIENHEVYTNNVIFNKGLLDANGFLIWDTTTGQKQTSVINQESYIIGKASFIVEEGGSAYFPIGGINGFYLAGIGPTPLSGTNRTVRTGAPLITWEAMYVDEAIGGDIPSHQYFRKYEEGMWRINPNKTTSTELTLFMGNIDIANEEGLSNHLRVLTRDNSSLLNNLAWQHKPGIGDSPKEIKMDNTLGSENRLLAIKTEAFTFTNAGEIPLDFSKKMSGLSNYEFTPGLSIEKDLPVELIDFTAEINAGVVELNWSTAQEFNNDGFYIEKSVDKQHWYEVDFIKGQGTTSVRNDYSAVDASPYQGVSYYRLVQVDLDGKMEVFSPLEISFGQLVAAEFLMYPNPNNKGVLNFKFYETSSSTIQLNIYTQLGEVVNRTKVDALTSNSLKIDTSQLASGVYIVEYINKKDRQLKKLIVN
ncbi:T9SS type A sorting domain-containing protein [Flammeovirga agarivorans]|uniref:T9SS type A sorting domain-containing protein n=1 Tax=Flammeovirga agarivorans TaxID=2726742 RepID=A0A7X8XYQ7_9BACT|nr:T9SS type A sorting domain-containing protein [Flammeovirga agarivorans]NLR94426.1 T9SS type A sorting domain-containing protein [Flammeovirga agarivorans]